MVAIGIIEKANLLKGRDAKLQGLNRLRRDGSQLPKKRTSPFFRYAGRMAVILFPPPDSNSSRAYVRFP
jgi:hypothetical protein